MDFTSWLTLKWHRQQFKKHQSHMTDVFSDTSSDLFPQDFSMETEAMSAKRESASRGASQLLHLREGDCPGLRAQLAQLEVDWNRLTSDLSEKQERLQQVQCLQRAFTICWRTKPVIALLKIILNK